ncbi:MAG: alpha-amylase family glycosyl hydrolase [Paludibacteraceae bacterium]|nr:alpha-amylase family glycosyl hydrolase [Paludibacteraceae bacterium]
MKKTLFILSLALIGVVCAWAQVTTVPAIIPLGYDGEVTIIFNPNQGNKGMVGATKCYAHIGISYNGQDWQKTGTWRDGKEKYKMTKNADGNWELKISPNLYSYFDVPTTTQITKICLVFNDGPGGSKEGKTAAGGDIFVYFGEAPCADIWTGFTPAAVTSKARPAGIVNGIYYGADGTSVTLCTYAASKTAAAKHVFLLGDMTDWQLDNKYQLYQDGNYFWINVTGLTPGKEYRFQYVVERADGKHVQISDLFSEKVIHLDDKYEPRTVDPTLIDYPHCGADGSYVTVIQTGKTPYPWSDATLNFKRPNKNNLVIYELWVYDYTTQHSIPGLMKRLDYLQGLGVNAIELMPVTEFDGQINWGYSPNHYFALDKAYGTPEMLKQFVDECHKRGMAVILDMVFNHATGLNPMNKLYPYGTDLKDNPWFNVTAPHSDNVYEDWNHGFAPTRDHFTRVLKYWLTEYKVDGYRLDLSHGLCSDKANTSVENLKYYYDNGVKAVSPTAYMILEHWGSNMGTERPQLISYGMQCWQNTNNAYSQVAMGWMDKDDALTDANKDGYIAYNESHDEERNQYKVKQYGNGDLKTNETARLNRVPLTLAFNVLLDGSHMLYQYGELGFDYSLFSKAGASGTSDSYKCEPKVNPESMGWLSAGSTRMKIYDKVAKIIKLRTQYLPSVFEGNPTAAKLGSGVEVRSVQWGNDVLVVGNFAASTGNSYTLPAGTWYDYLNDNQKITTSKLSLNPGDLRILVGSPVVTDIDEVNMDVTPAVAPTKFIQNGRFLILRDGVLFDALGRPL